MRQHLRRPRTQQHKYCGRWLWSLRTSNNIYYCVSFTWMGKQVGHLKLMLSVLYPSNQTASQASMASWYDIDCMPMKLYMKRNFFLYTKLHLVSVENDTQNTCPWACANCSRYCCNRYRSVDSLLCLHCCFHLQSGSLVGQKSCCIACFRKCKVHWRPVSTTHHVGSSIFQDSNVQKITKLE